MLRTLFRPSLLLACVVASGCGPSAEEPQTPSPQGTHTQSIRWPKWIRVVAADVVGAVSGAQQGAEIGKNLGSDGDVIGGIIGGVISGAQASSEAASRQTTTTGVIAGSRSSVEPSNARNSFDHIGRHHNTLLDGSVGIIGPGGCIPNPFPFPFPRDRTKGPIWDFALRTLNAPPELMRMPQLEAAWNKSLDFVASFDKTEDIEVAISNGVKSGMLTAPVGERLITYFNAVAPLDTDRMIEATKSFEEKTLTDKGLTAQERQSLLSGFSVARYSAAYWGDQAARQQTSPWCGCSK